MGLCFSKKKKKTSADAHGQDEAPVVEKKVLPCKNSVKEQCTAAAKDVAVAETKLFGIAVPDGDKEKIKRAEDAVPPMKPAKEIQEPTPEVRAVGTPVRASSCTKEEVDAILIQCGRLSRSSSGNAVPAGEAGSGGGHRRRYSGSKRSFDFDNEKEDDEYERSAAASRPSPRRRSRERSSNGGGGGNGGSRLVSRSPGRRTDSVAASGERAKPQPGKMVSVPATEKPESNARRPATSSAASGKRSASPRSHSPARVTAPENAAPAQAPSLSRSSSKRADHSPFRRNPLAEIDDNAGRAAAAGSFKNQTSVQAPTKVSGGRSSRRSSRDMDQQALGADISVAVAPNSYASILLEDIQNYHQQHSNGLGPAPAFSLPACVSKACSILDAVADLNSSSSETRTYAADIGRSDPCRGSVVVESEIVVKDDLMEPSLHKYVSVRDIRSVEDAEPQESAGSNSFVAGSQWTGPWEPNNSVDSSAHSNNNNAGEELESPQDGGASPVARPRQRGGQHRAVPASPGRSGRSRASGSRHGNRGNAVVGNGRLGAGRALSAPTAAAST